jgi:hypothetical protein
MRGYPISDLWYYKDAGMFQGRVLLPDPLSGRVNFALAMLSFVHYDVVVQVVCSRIGTNIPEPFLTRLDLGARHLQ